MNGYTDELRLCFCLLLNAAVFGCAVRFAWRAGISKPLQETAPGARAVQATCDGFLLYFIIQYASVALPGVVGLLNSGTMAMVATVACAMLWFGARRKAANGAVGTPRILPMHRRRLSAGQIQHVAFIGCAIFAVGFIGSYVWVEWSVPPVATDSLVYHLPNVVQWLQTGRLGLYETWYWNPAATYSPATGMTFMTWLMAPMHNDVLVRFVQVPPLLMIFALAARLCLMMGADLVVSGLVAVATVLSRALFSESVIPKDDLFVTAFVCAAIVALHPDNLRGRLGPWRAGAALGMVLASKYTALIVCPIFFFLLDSPFRARWRKRDYALAIAVVLLLAAPWYLRNVWLTGNPLYPVDVRVGGIKLFNGMFATERDRQLRSGGGIRKMLAGTYHSLPPALIALLCVSWALACVRGGRAALRDPVQRACLFGSVIVLALFIVTSPHHEVRYVFPLITLWFATAGFAISRWIPSAPARWGAAPVLAGFATANSFDLKLFDAVAAFAACAACAAVVAMTLEAGRLSGWLSRQSLSALAAAAGLALATWGYIDWHAWLDGYRQSVYLFWGEAHGALYPDDSPVWKFVRSDAVPSGSTIAYAHTTLVYPLYGFDEDRHVVYAPVRKDLHDFVSVPRLGQTVPGDYILTAMLNTMNTDPDRATWMENLRQRHADLLVIMLPKLFPDLPDPEPQALPPELAFAKSDPAHFEPIFTSEHGIVYRVR